MVGVGVLVGRSLIRVAVFDTSSGVGDDADNITPVGGESKIFVSEGDVFESLASCSSVFDPTSGRFLRVVMLPTSAVEGEVESAGLLAVGEGIDGPAWMGATTVCPLMTVTVCLEVRVTGLSIYMRTGVKAT